MPASATAETQLRGLLHWRAVPVPRGECHRGRLTASTSDHRGPLFTRPGELGRPTTTAYRELGLVPRFSTNNGRGLAQFKA
jgi:hypothetical protein